MEPLLQCLLIDGQVSNAFVDLARNLVPGELVFCFDQLVAHQTTTLELHVQGSVGLPNRDKQLLTETIQERHAKALQLDGLGLAILKRVVEMTVDEVEVRRPRDRPSDGVPSSVILDDERTPARGYSNDPGMPNLMLSK